MTAPTERTGATDSEVEASPAWQAGYEAGQNVGGVRGYRQGYADAVGATVPLGEERRTAEERLAAVLALHISDGDENFGWECRGCRAECLYCEADHPWPCPTARAAGAS